MFYFARVKTAVVILNWNGKQLLEKFLPSVVQFSPGATVYVADNASSDDSVAFVSTHFPMVQIIRNKTNGGFAKGYNEALSSLKEDVFVLLNSDVEVTPNWLEPMLEHLQKHSETAVVQPKLLDYRKKEYFEYAGAAGGFIDLLGYPFCKGRIFNTLEKDEGQYDQDSEILWASGACLVIRRVVYEELNGLDELYFAHQEEIDLCWRAHCAGYRIYYIAQSKVYHLGGATLAAMNPQKTFLNFRNSLFNMLKNIPGVKAYLLIFIRLCLDGLAGIKFLLEGKPRHTWAVVRAHFSFYGYVPQICRKRKRENKKNTYAYTGSIVWKYYVSGRKKFSDL